VAEVVWHEYIRLYSSDVSHSYCIVGQLFIGIISSLSWPLACHFLLLGWLQTASRTSWILLRPQDSCIIISFIIVEVVAVSGEGGVDMVVLSSSIFIRESTAALSIAVSSLEVW
jgi:hypothetical protein